MADLLGSHFLAVAENVPENTGPVQCAGCIGGVIALHHATNHAHQVVQHATIMVAVERCAQGGQSRFGGSIVGQTAQQSGKNAVSCNGSLFFVGADLLAHLTQHVIGKLALQYVH